LLRQDNADLRLSHHGHRLGLISDLEFGQISQKTRLINDGFEKTKSIKLKPDIINEYLNTIGETEVDITTDLYNLTKRSNVRLHDLLKLSVNGDPFVRTLVHNEDITEQIQINIKYEGYIARQLKDITYFLDNESKVIPDWFDYSSISSLSNEAREKLIRIRPASLGQASRISGVSASDVSILSLFLK